MGCYDLQFLIVSASFQQYVLALVLPLGASYLSTLSTSSIVSTNSLPASAIASACAGLSSMACMLCQIDLAASSASGPCTLIRWTSFCKGLRFHISSKNRTKKSSVTVEGLPIRISDLHCAYEHITSWSSPIRSATFRFMMLPTYDMFPQALASMEWHMMQQ